jgi:leucyl aminopeptidase (aminopeptidase T)
MIEVSKQLQDVARKVMDNALPIQQGEVVAFAAGLQNLDLAYAFAAECEVRGIETLVRSQGDFIGNARVEHAPIESFEREPRLTKALIDAADWYILMTGSRHDSSLFQEPHLRDRMLEIQKRSKWSFDDVFNRCLETSTHAVAFLDPSLEQAEALSKSYEEVQEMFLDSLDIDYAALTELGKRIINRVESGGVIHLTCPNGTDLKLNADGRYWVNDDGQPDSRSSSVTPYIHNLPVGEVFVAPIEDSARGVMFPKSLPGSLVRNWRIEFGKQGKAEISAEEGFEFAKPRLEKATGNPYSIAEFAFGTNPCGDMLLATEKAYGTCHVAIGENIWLGGTNECSLHWDFLIENPTVTIDGECILSNGEFAI